MFETLQGIDIFFIVMALAVLISTIIGSLIGWHVFGIARDAHKVVRAAREEGEQVVHEAAQAARDMVAQRAAALSARVVGEKERAPRKSRKKLISG